MLRWATTRRTLLGVIAFLVGLLGLQVPAHAGGVLIVITGIHVGSPVMGTQDGCRGWVEYDEPVVPVTINASFFGDDPVGPYATSEWTGGFGSLDDHFGTGGAHDHYQHFHILMRASSFNGWGGPGMYTVFGTVQDVGLGGGFTTRSKDVYLPPPSPTVAKVKCTITPELGPQFVVDQVMDAALGKLKEAICELCTQIKGVYDTAKGYSDALDGLLYDSMVDDPPDPSYQLLAQATPAPFIPAPAGLTSAQQTAYTRLITQLAADVGTARAIYATVNRVWGADNAASSYWHRQQLLHLADLTDQLAAGLDALPPLWTGLIDSFTGDLPDFTVGPSDVAASLDGIDHGVPEDEAAVLDQLGVSDGDQADIAEIFATYVDPRDVSEQSGAEALSDTNAPGLAGAMRTWGRWARRAVEEPAPQVGSVSPATVPTSGGSVVRIDGAHLASVTGVDFGPSEVGHGQATLLGCSDTVCDVYAPPGHGTVDVVAVGPGGASKTSPGDQVTYTEPDVPHVTSIFPTQGPMVGGTQISVFGSGLAEGRVDFGIVPADEWDCRPTHCTAVAPESGSAGPVDVTVLNGDHRSATVVGARYTYLTDAPPQPPPPTVTGLSPSSGTHLGGEQVTVTGTHFQDVSSAQFGDGFDVLDDIAVLDDNHLTLTTPSMDEGPQDLVLFGPGGASAVNVHDVYTATAAPPTITSISPTTGTDLGGTQVTVRGTGLTGAGLVFEDSSGTGDDDPQCTATTCTFTTGPLDPGDPVGAKHLIASTEDGDSTPTAADVFTFTRGPAPVVTGLDPDTGSTSGGSLVVTGQHLNGGTVTIGGSDADSALCTSGSCVVEVPEHAAGDVAVRVTTHVGTSAAGPASTYSYVTPARPVVTEVSPGHGWGHGLDEILVSGHHLDGGAVRFGAADADITGCTESQCTVLSAPGSDTARTVDVTVTTAGGTSATGPQARYAYDVPTVTSVSPSSGWTDGTTEVTVTGTHLAGGTIDFGADTGIGVCDSETVCEVTAPSRSTTGRVDVRATSEDDSTQSPVTSASKFTYTARPLPTVTSVSPNHGNDLGDERVTITGTALQGATVTVGGNRTAANETTCQPTSCTFTTPFSNTDGAVQVVATTSAGASATGAASKFTYEPPGVPTVTSVSPARGTTAGGDAVTVTGDDLAGTEILFGTARQSATCDRTTCTVTTVPHDPGAVSVTARSDAGTSAADPHAVFTFVVPPVPRITSLSPDTGPASGGVSVTLTGHDLRGGQLSVGGTPTTATCTDTTCTFTQPPGPAGVVHVTVTTPGGTSSPATFHDDSVTLTEHDVPGVDGAAGGGVVARGIGGDIWFALPNDDALGRVKPDGTIVTFPTPANGRPTGLTLGPDGRMWFTEAGSSHIGAMVANGTVTQFAVPDAPDDLRFITAGPDGRLWFNLGNGAIGAITTAGQVTEYPVPDQSVVPYHVLAGPDGRIWFTEWGGASIGAITTTGVVSEYPLHGADLLSWDLTSGPDGRLWFTEAVGQAMAAVDTATGEVTTYPLPFDAADPQGLTWGPDGRFWFVAPEVDRVAAWDPDSQAVTYYPMPQGGGRAPKYVAMDGRGALWVTELNGSHLLSLTGIPATAPPRVTGVAPRYGAAGDTVTVTGSTLATTQGVTVGGHAATFHVVDPAHLTVTVPAGSGAAPVQVTTAHGISAASPGAVFHYGSPPAPGPTVTGVDPPSGPVGGGTTITVTGTHLTHASVKVGTHAATGVSCTATSCTAVVPAGALGTVDVVATTTAGSSPTSAADHFTYLQPAPPQPTVTGVSPGSGPAAGGTDVRITGIHLSNGAVWFGTSAASGTCADTSCTLTAPAGAVGTVHVRVTTDGGTSPRVAADRFTYTGAGTTATTTTVSAAPTSVEAGSPVTFTAHVTPQAATGQVTFTEDGTVIGTAGLHSGTATFTTSSLTVGAHDVLAAYPGNATYAPSTAPAPASVTVIPAPAKEPTTTILAVSPSSAYQGQAVTLTAHVSPAAASGPVIFSDGAAQLGQATLHSGTAVLTLATLSLGSHRIVARYAGSSAYEPSTSDPETVDVIASQATATSLSGPASAALHSAVTFTAAVAPTSATGQVRFVDRTTSLVLGTKPLTGGHAALTTSVLGTGRHEVTASFVNADSAYLPSVSDPLVVTISDTTPPPPPPPAVLPGVPRNVVAKAGKHKVIVHWSAPADPGSSPITQYVVLVYRGHKLTKQVTTTAVRSSVTKLKPGKTYRFAVYAVNAVGHGQASPATKGVKPKR